MAVIHIDGKTYTVAGGENLLRTCLSLGLEVPYFCYHPALGAAGSCRQCAVKQFASAEDVEAGKGRIVMSCMVPTSDDLYISINDSEAKAFRAAMIELLMTNHPHDCPTCAEGGHCQLQDMTYLSGHHARKYRFTKRTHENQDLGPFIAHEMNRCIACYRCVRFYRDYAGGSDLGVFASANRVFFGRAGDGVLESEFAGNLSEVCPTGVFTDRSHGKRYNRKWDMQYAPSICHGCAVGCNISAGERYGELRRIENRYNGSVNGYFLCDRGRFGYGYVNDRSRPCTARVDGQEQGPENALRAVANLLRGKKVLGIGSANASLESNFQLKTLVGAQHFCAGESCAALALVSQALALQQAAAYVPTPREIEQADAILILGEDLTQTAARLALAVRQAANNAGRAQAADLGTPDWLDEPRRRITQDALAPIYLAALSPTRLDDIAQASCIASPQGVLDYARAVRDIVQGRAIPEEDPQGLYAHAAEVAAALCKAKRPLVIGGTSLQSPALIENAAQIAAALPGCGLNLVVPRVNSAGLAYLGGRGFAAFEPAAYDAVIVMENDLLGAPEGWREAVLDKTLVVLDHQSLSWHERARALLPAASFAEGDGTVVSYEGRAQRFFQVYDSKYHDPHSCIEESWRWLYALRGLIEQGESDWSTLDRVIAELAAAQPALAKIAQAAPPAAFRDHRMTIAREPSRYSGRTAMRAPLSVHEPKQPQDADSPLAFSMEGYRGRDMPAALIPFAWTPGWNSPQAWNTYLDTPGGKVRGEDNGVRLDRAPDTAPAPEIAFPQVKAYPVVPVYDLFASAPWRDKLPLFDARERPARILMTPKVASVLAVVEGERLSVTHRGRQRMLPVHIDERFADDCIGYPMRSGERLDGDLRIDKGSRT